MSARVSNRNIIFIGAFIAVYIVSAANVFTVFDQPLQKATGGSPSEVALALTIYQTVMAVFGIISGRIVDRVGPKLLMFVGGLVFGGGWILTGLVSSVPMLYISYGLLAGAGNGLLYNPAINTALKWFAEKRGVMNGVLLCAASIGGITLSRIGALLNDRVGQKGFIFIGIAFLALAWIAGLLVAPVPETAVVPRTTEASAIRQDVDHGPVEMLRTATFWLMLFTFACAATSGLMLIGKLSSIAEAQLLVDSVTASSFVMVNAAANLVGRLGTGKLCDKIGEIPTLALVIVSTIVGLFGLSISKSTPMFVVFLCILGAAFGGVLVIFPSLTSRRFGLKNLGTNYGIMFFAYPIAALVGPQIGSRLVVDSKGTMAYTNAYYAAIGVAAVGLILLVTLYQIERKRMAAEELAAV